MRPDIMMVDLTTNDHRNKEARVKMKRKTNREQTLLKDMISPQQITVLETRDVADT